MRDRGRRVLRGVCVLVLLVAAFVAGKLTVEATEWHLTRWFPVILENGFLGAERYAIWLVLLGCYAVVARDLAQWRPGRAAWTRRNLWLIAAVVALTSFEVVMRFRAGMTFRAPFGLEHVVVAVVLAPVVEEWLFRGVLWKYTSELTSHRIASVALAIVVTSVLFAWWHVEDTFDPFSTSRPLLGHFMFGMGMALLRWRFDAIGVGVIAHAIYNAGGVISVVPNG